MSELDERQRRSFLKLIEDYAADLDSAVARTQLEKVRQTAPGIIYFAWAGSRDEPGAQEYY